LLVPLEDETSLVLLAGAGVGMPEAVDLPSQEALRLRNNRSLAEHCCCVKHLGIDWVSQDHQLSLVAATSQPTVVNSMPRA